MTQQSQYGYGTLGSEGQSSYSHGPPPPPAYDQGIPKNMANPPPPGFNIPEERQYMNTDNNHGFDNFEFSDQTIRKGFIRKVYSILMVQLLVTLCFIVLFFYNESLKMWTMRNPGVFYGALAITFVTLIAMACCENVRRHSPQNFIFLGIFTVAEGFLLGTATSTYSAESVMLAVGITAAVSLGLTIFSFQTKWDFTAMGGILFGALIILLLFGILAMFFPILKVAYACAGALLFCVYLVYDTQQMMGGKHKYSISPEEYIFAALNLYLDIINIFVYILAIFGSQND